MFLLVMLTGVLTCRPAAGFPYLTTTFFLFMI